MSKPDDSLFPKIGERVCDDLIRRTGISLDLSGELAARQGRAPLVSGGYVTVIDLDGKRIEGDYHLPEIVPGQSIIISARDLGARKAFVERAAFITRNRETGVDWFGYVLQAVSLYTEVVLTELDEDERQKTRGRVRLTLDLR